MLSGDLKMNFSTSNKSKSKAEVSIHS